jgi:Asp-tRNA(Asn)/Glu-tRNA(Gln) amidotransferase A subunit family amidase
MGTNCRLSANSGLPAISVPIGFDADGVPIGLELLGRAHSEQQLLNLSLTIENVLGARRLPASTP